MTKRKNAGLSLAGLLSIFKHECGDGVYATAADFLERFFKPSKEILQAYF